MSVTHYENVSEPWFTTIKLGLKKVEGRKNKGRFHDMKVGDIIIWQNIDFGLRVFSVEIVRKTPYPNLTEYLETEGLENCLPGIDDILTGVSVYEKYFDPEDVAKYGIVAIEMKLV